MLFAATSITVDPAWPWSLPAVGVTALAGVAVFLGVVTVWTYLGVRGASWRRIILVVTLRLLALALAFMVVLRPSLAFDEVEDSKPSRILFLFDASESMKITDDFKGDSRWANARRILDTAVVKAALARLTAARVELVYYQGAEDLRPYDPASQPTGKATDMGTWLHEIRQRHGREKDLRGLVILSDGADNGTKFPTLDEAGQLRPNCPVFAFGLGKPTTNFKQNHLEFTDIRVEPDPIPVKGKMTVTGYINAPGFENSSVKVSLWIQEVGAKEPRKVASDPHLLKKTQRNEVVLTCDAPQAAGEIKVTLKTEPLFGEVAEVNNEISTYATVTKEGVSILWVEGRKRLESVFAIRHALKKDRRFRPYFIERLNDDKEGGDLYELDKRHYDVIVIGDISAARFAAGDPDIFRKISSLIQDKGTGLLLMGGYKTPWGEDNDWNQAQPLISLLPVPRGSNGQIDGKITLEPTPAGEKYLFHLDENPKKNLWRKIFDPLDGATRFKDVPQTSRVLASGELVLAGGDVQQQPLLVERQEAGKGRVLAFAGDTTWKVWRRNKEALPAYARFWKQLMLYLARQENMDSNVQITLETRRVAADSNQRVAFTLRARDKTGLDVKYPKFTVKVTGPDKVETDVGVGEVKADGGEYRGYFLKTNLAGDYSLRASVAGKDSEGNPLPSTASEAHFLAYAQDRETRRPAADHEFLAKIAAASGGQFALADERKLAGLLDEILLHRDKQPHAKAQLWPDWRRYPASSSLGDQVAALWNSTALPCFLAFVTLLCSEWYLRRRWGLI